MLAAQARDDLTHEPDAFAQRLERWGPDLAAGLAIYPEPPVQRVLDIMVRAHSRRRESLRELDGRRLLRPDWFAGQDQIGYVCYVDRFAGSLAGIHDRIGYLRELGVTYLHLMPLLDPRDGADDGGYSVRDYRT